MARRLLHPADWPPAASGRERATLEWRRSRTLPPTALYFADLHNHTLLSDGEGEPADAYGAMRSAGLDIAAVTDHARVGFRLASLPRTPHDLALATFTGLTQASWHRLGGAADRANDDGEFVALRGFEWSSPSVGHMNVWFSRRWIDPLAVQGLTKADMASTWTRDVLARIHPAARKVADRAIASVSDRPSSVAGFHSWLGASPRLRPDGGGLDGLASFNHPGREGCDFDDFVLDPWLVPSVVGIEVFNRQEDYLFEGTDAGALSPIGRCLDAGWRVGMLGVSDEHEARWGGRPNTGRTGIWARELTRSGVREALWSRRFFATTAPGLRLDMLGNGHRMGSVVPAQRGGMRIEVDVHAGPERPRAALSIQVLGAGSPVPRILAACDLGWRDSDPVVLDVPLDETRDRWVMVRVSDLTEPPDPRATAPYDGFGRAIAYGSPWFIARRSSLPAGGLGGARPIRRSA